MNWKVMILALCGMSMVIAIFRPSAFDEQPVPAVPKTTTKTVVVRQAAIKPDGYMSEEQCARVQTGLPVADLVFQYGWPAGDYSFSNFSERFFYPVHDRGDDKCVVVFDDNKVVSTLYRDE